MYLTDEYQDSPYLLVSRPSANGDKANPPLKPRSLAGTGHDTGFFYELSTVKAFERPKDPHYFWARNGEPSSFETRYQTANSSDARIVFSGRENV
jgi:hypothetical protein